MFSNKHRVKGGEGGNDICPGFTWNEGYFIITLYVIGIPMHDVNTPIIEITQLTNLYYVIGVYRSIIFLLIFTQNIGQSLL